MTWDVIPTSLLISFLWGASPVLHKFLFMTNPLSSQTMIVSGSFYYFLCTCIYFYFNQKIVLSELQQLSYSTLAIMAFSAVLAGFFANYLYFHVLRESSSYVVSALIFSSPFFTFILARLFLREEITVKSALGVVLIVLGVVLLALSKKSSSNVKVTNVIRAD
jgi:drug/metabolite transporter (DMT)-like permease